MLWTSSETLFKGNSMNTMESGRDKVTLPTFDLQRLPIYEHPKSLERILKFVTGNGKKEQVVFPDHMQQIKEVSILVATLKKENGLVLLGRSLASTMDISTRTVRPPGVLFDACVISPNRPTLLLSFVDGVKESENVQVYNTAVARGVVNVVRTYSAATFALVNGVMSHKDIESYSSYREAFKAIEQRRSKLLNPYSLLMNESKMTEVIKALVASIAIMQPVLIEDELARFYKELHVMTFDQFCIVTDSIDRVGSSEIEVGTDTDIIPITLELAKRLNRSSEITLFDTSRRIPEMLSELGIVSKVKYEDRTEGSDYSLRLEQQTQEILNNFVINTSDDVIKRTHVLSVEGIPMEITGKAVDIVAATQELLELYFESACKGTGTVEHVDLNPHRHDALVYFSSPDAVDWVMMKKTHLLREKLLSVTRYNRTRPKDFKTWAMDISDEKTVELRGGLDFDSETLKDYFEDEEGGGMCVTDIRHHGDSAFITFKTETDARLVCERIHALDDKEFKLEQLKPRPKYDDRFFISGLKATTTTEALKKFLERKIQSTVEITYGKEPGTAVVKVTPPFRLTEVRKLCRILPLQGQFLHVSSIPISNCVCVRSLNRIKSRDGLRLYFQNPRSGNANKVRVVDVNIKDDEKTAFVYFERHEGLDSVVTWDKHELSGNLLYVSLFLEGVEIEEQPKWKTEPQPFTMDSLDKNVVRFIKESSKYTHELERTLMEKMTGYKWDSRGTAVLLHYIGKLDEQTDIKSTWNVDAQRAFVKFMSSFWLKEIEVPFHQLWTDVAQRLATIIMPSVEECRVFEYDEECKVCVVGHEHIPMDVADNIEKMVREFDENQRMDKHNQVDKLLNYDSVKLQFLKKMDYERKIRDHFTSLDIDISADSVKLRGKCQDVAEVKKDLEKELYTVAVSSFENMTQIQLRLPSDGYLSKYIDKRLKQRKPTLKGIWRTEGSTLKIASQSDSDIEEIIAVITESLCEQEIPLVPEMMKVLQTEEWKTFRSEWETKPGVNISTEIDIATLRISATKEDIAEIVENVKNVLSSKTILTRTKEISEGIFKFLTKFSKHQLKNIETQTKTDIKERQSSLKVTGPEACLDDALVLLDDLERNTYYRSSHVTAAGSRKIILSEQGKRYIEALEKRERCVILEHFETTSYDVHIKDQSLKCVTGKPVAILLVNLPGDKTLTLYRGDITELDVELLVNPASTDLNHTPIRGLSKQIFEKGGPLLRESVEKVCSSHEDFSIGKTVVTDAGNLKCKYVAHAFCPSWSGGKNEEHDHLNEVVINCLDEACHPSQKLKSVAFPALSTGTYSFPPRDATKIIVTGVRDYFDKTKHKNNQSWSVDHVYVCDNNVQKVQAFAEVIREVFPPSAIQQKMWNERLSSEPSQQVSKGNDVNGDPDTVTLHFYSDKKESIDAAVDAINSFCQNLQDEIKIDDKLLKTLNAEQVQQVKDTEVSFDVKIDFQYRLGKIRIRGLQRDVTEAHSKIRNIMEEEVALRESLQPTYQWKYYEICHDGPEVLNAYETKTNADLEKAFADRQPGYDVMIHDQNIHHDFGQMVRSPVSDPSSVTQILRNESFKGSHCFDSPITWTKLSSDTVATVEVNKESEEYAKLEENLLDESNKISNVVKIERIQSEQMWMNFLSKQRLMSEQNARAEKVAVLIWHGTERGDAEGLYKFGEKYEYAYRQGVRFAGSLDDLMDEDEDEDEDDYHYLLQCRVLKGISAQDINNIQFPPMDMKRGVRYDSVVIRDDDDRPILYKIFNGTQVYPEYLITFI